MTIRAQKSALTREIKQLKAYILDLKQAYKRGKDRGDLWGMLHGDRVYSWTIENYETELLVLEIKRKKLNSK